MLIALMLVNYYGTSTGSYKMYARFTLLSLRCFKTKK